MEVEEEGEAEEDMATQRRAAREGSSGAGATRGGGGDGGGGALLRAGAPRCVCGTGWKDAEGSPTGYWIFFL